MHRVLETERLLLWRFTEADADALLHLESDPDTRSGWRCPVFVGPASRRSLPDRRDAGPTKAGGTPVPPDSINRPVYEVLRHVGRGPLADVDAYRQHIQLRLLPYSHPGDLPFEADRRNQPCPSAGPGRILPLSSRVRFPGQREAFTPGQRFAPRR